MTPKSIEQAGSTSLPMNPIEFLVLAVLNRSESHGYGIVQEVRDRTNGRVRIRPGNLYRVLDRLIERGFLEESGRRPRTGDDERRTYYRITRAGRKELRSEASLLSDILDEVVGGGLNTEAT